MMLAENSLRADRALLVGSRDSRYGKTTITGTDPIGPVNSFRWLSSLQNTTSGGADSHYKLGARYYDSQGHFTQPDPVAGGLEDPRALTSYNYAGSDPINQSDPSGYCWTGFGWACGAASYVGDAAGWASRTALKIGKYATPIAGFVCAARAEITGPHFTPTSVGGYAQAFLVGSLEIGGCSPLGPFLPSPESVL